MTSHATWLSVIMPTYNGERYVAQALESLRPGVSDGGMEVVVVDDGSTDGTLGIVERYADELPVRIIRYERVGNWVATTNAGLRAANGKYACFLHQDDFWLPGRVAAIRGDIETHGDVRLLFHEAIFVGPTGRRLGRWHCPFRDGFIAPEQFVERLLVQNFIAIPSPVFDREDALRGGGLDESLWYTADWDLWLRLGAAAPVRFLREPLAAFRIHGESQTMARPRSEGNFRRQMTIVLERHLQAWPVQGRRRRGVERVAQFSAAVNASLASAARGEGRPSAAGLLTGFLSLGPSGWRRFLRDSRIVDRVLPRVRVTGSGPDQ